ncbi:MAG: CxxC-x17-CxxC domain-containing protein, partial [Myxococcota bacterium]
GGPRQRYSPSIEVQEKPARTFRPRDSDYGNSYGGGGDRGGNRPRFEVKCSECGANTTVPFEPAPGRPVYCRNCYQNKRR